MKSLILFILFILLAFIAGGCAVKVPSKTFHLSELVTRVETRAYVVRRFRGEFEKTRHSQVFNRDLTVTGRIVFQKPNRFSLITRGDVNVEVISDGTTIAMIHDGKDMETYRLQGERDMSRFSDPLMLLVNGIGNGAFRKFKVDRKVKEKNATRIELDPGRVTNFERVAKAVIWFGNSGQFNRVRIVYKNGNWDETIFRSWSILAEDSPEISSRPFEICPAIIGPDNVATRHLE